MTGINSDSTDQKESTNECSSEFLDSLLVFISNTGSKDSSNRSSSESDVLILDLSELECEQGEQDSNPECKDSYSPIFNEFECTESSNNTESEGSNNEDDEMPHLGIVWGKEALLKSLYPYKGRCVSDDSPDRFEMGTPQYELLAGLSATVDYFAQLGASCGGTGDKRSLIGHAFDASRAYEEPLTNRLIAGLQNIPGVTIYGIVNPNRIGERVPTVSLRHDTLTPDDIATALARAGIHVWHGHNYAYEPARALNLPLDEGVVRIGLAHYNTESEVERTLEEIAKTVTQAG